MRRSILTGVFLFTLSAGACGIAVADESALPAGAPVSSAAVPASPAAAFPAAAVPTASADSDDAAPPAVAADVATWNAAPMLDVSSVPVKHSSRLRRFASGIVSRSSALASSLTRSAMRFIGTPYVFGGTRSTGFDCSGYVQHVFAMLGMYLPRTADAQFDAGHSVAPAMEPGDLVFFHTYAQGVSHVGIYLGHRKFIHSSSSRGVSISSLNDRYWAPRYVGAKRVFGS